MHSERVTSPKLYQSAAGIQGIILMHLSFQCPFLISYIPDFLLNFTQRFSTLHLYNSAHRLKKWPLNVARIA